MKNSSLADSNNRVKAVNREFNFLKKISKKIVSAQKKFLNADFPEPVLGEQVILKFETSEIVLFCCIALASEKTFAPANH